MAKKLPAPAPDHDRGGGRCARRPRRWLILATLATSTLAVTGCQRSLFRQAEARTQFERFELMRGEYRPAEEPDVFGNPQPALRARLLP